MNSLVERIRGLPGRFSPAARAFLLSIFITGIVNAAWLLFFNIYILRRGIDKDVLGLINAAPSISAMFFTIPLGILADRIGKRQAMILGLAAAVVGWTLEVTLLSPGLILAASLLAGAGSTLWFLSQAPYMMEISDEANRTLLFSLNYGMSTLAGAAGNLFAGQLPAAFSRWLGVASESASAYQAVLVASVFITAAGILPLISRRGAAKPVRAAAATPRLNLRAVFSRPLTIRLALPNLLLGCGAALIVGYFNVFYVEEWSVSDSHLGVLFSALSFVVGIGTLIGPRLVSLLKGKVQAVIALQMLGILSLLVCGFSPALWLSEIGLVVRGTVMMTAGALFSAYSMEKSAPEERGAVNSLMYLTFQFGWAVGPFISGIVQMRFGFAPLFIATSIFYAAATFLIWRFFGKPEPEQNPVLAAG